MIAEKPINISEEYRRIALQGEPILDNSQDIVIISMQSYKNYEEIAKAKHNAEYMAMLDRGFNEIDNGGVGITKTIEELRAMEHE
ncbi:MAG: type II toxin-antitoxin system Phd/YefM family antitoxin [Butyrivibrio sp.]|nr:type II toxin-antitoxin system Phd/YefM family antitoxin [Butyrivibrio sp.]